MSRFLLVLLIVALILSFTTAIAQESKENSFKVQLARHATLLITVGQSKILVDPMFSECASHPPIPSTPNQVKNPLVPLAVSLPELLAVDAILLTHTHFDHFDDVAKKMLPRNIPLFCQPMDAKSIQELGFTYVIPVESTYQWGDLTISRVSGKHGRGELEKMMGPVSGFIFTTKSKNSLYITGDCIYNEEVEYAMEQFQPNYIIAYTGAAQFLFGLPITMTKEEIESLCTYSKKATIIAVHLEAVNHCVLTRKDLHVFLQQKNLTHRVLIPKDGEILHLNPSSLQSNSN
ncbi:MAG: MBL fold metallo-hydrolase [Candidatus Brocadiae bacterium]|nr:MBL fold metallo-hydrolase [Candidatus Brocadiia bacterium]